jgi:hypothetical protein
VEVGGEAGEQAQGGLAAGLQGEGDGSEKEEKREGGEEGEASIRTLRLLSRHWQRTEANTKATGHCYSKSLCGGDAP